MLTGNNLFKHDKDGNIVRLTTDDIPEGDYNKYCLNYADGKNVGDIVTRFSPNEIPCHSLLNGQVIYAYDHRDLEAYCLECKEKASTDDNYAFYNKTEAEYLDFLRNNTWAETEQSYCPFFVLGTSNELTYEIQKEDLVGYTPIAGASGTAFSGTIYKDSNLNEIYDIDSDGWIYNGVTTTSALSYIHLPTIPTYTNGNVKSFYFVVSNSRVDDDTTSIRSVRVGETVTIPFDADPYVRNVGTIQNLVLNFGIPEGKASTIEIGNVISGEYPAVYNRGTENAAIFDFVFPQGEKGDAGGVLVVNYIQEGFPASASLNEKLYNRDDDVIYIYDDSDWQVLEPADSGMIYLYNNTVYYYDGSDLVSTYADIQKDEKTIQNNENGEIQAIGLVAKKGGIVYDWVGSLHDWEQGRSDGEILDSYICFITDD